MKCPNCDLENLESAIKCDCGYYFRTNKIEKKSIDKIQKITVKSIKNIYVTGLIGFTIIGLIIIIHSLIKSFEGFLETGQILNNLPLDRFLLGISIILFGNLIWAVICEGLTLLLKIYEKKG